MAFNNRNDDREIIIKFINNAEETKRDIDALKQSLDVTSEEFKNLEEESNQLAQSIKDVGEAMNNSSENSEDLNKVVTNLTDRLSKADKTYNNINKSSKTLDNNIKQQTTSTKSLTQSVSENGGAMAILNTITGGWAQTVKDGYEALSVFNTNINLGTIAQRAYTLVVGTSTGALKAFKIALAATGIGLAVVAIGELVANWDKLTSAIFGSNKELDEFRKNYDKSIGNIYSSLMVYDLEFYEKLQAFEDIILDKTKSDQQRRAAINDLNKLLGITEEINKITLKTVDEQPKKVVEIINFHKQLQSNQLELVETEKGYNEQLEERKKLLQEQLELVYKVKNEGETSETKKQQEELNQKIEAQNVLLTNMRANYLYTYGKVSVMNQANLEETEAKIQAEEKLKKAEEARLQAIEKAIEEENKRKENEIKLMKEMINLNQKYQILNKENVGDKLLIKYNNDLNNSETERIEKLKEINETIRKGTDNYKFATQTVKDYYDAEEKRINNLSDGLKLLMSEFENIQSDNESLISEGSIKSLEQVKNNFKLFIDNIEDAEQKQYFQNIFKTDEIDNRIQEIKTIEQLLSKTLLSTRPLDEGIQPTTSVNGRNKIIEENKLVNDELLQQQLDFEIKELELLYSTEEEKQRIRDYYNQLRINNNNNANELIELSNRDHYRVIMELGQASSQASMALIDAGIEFANEAEAEKIKSSKAYKATMIGLTTIDTLAGATAVFMDAQKQYPAPYGTIIGASLAAGVLATGMANIAKIKNVKIGGSAGGEGATSGAMAQPNVSFVSSSDNQISQSITKAVGNKDNKPIQTYVTVGQVTTAQQLQRQKIEANSI